MKKRVLAGVLCLVVVGTGVLVGLRIVDKKGDVAGIREEEMVVGILPVEEKVEMAVYENRERGYRFEYPLSWNRTVLSDIDDVSLKSVDGEVVHVLRQINYRDLTMKEWLEDNFSEDFVNNFEEKSFGGREALVDKDRMIYFVSLLTNEVLTISYNRCAQTDCGPGERNMDEFFGYAREFGDF